MPTAAQAAQSKALPVAMSSFSHTSSKTPTLVFPGNWAQTDPALGGELLAIKQTFLALRGVSLD